MLNTRHVDELSSENNPKGYYVLLSGGFVGHIHKEF